MIKRFDPSYQDQDVGVGSSTLPLGTNRDGMRSGESGTLKNVQAPDA